MPKIVYKGTDKDAILAFLTGKIPEEQLPDAAKLKLERIIFADDLIRKHFSMSKVLPILQRVVKLKKLAKSYSRTSAFRDYQDAQEIFGSMVKMDRNYHVSILMENIKQTRDMAVVDEDLKTMATCDANLTKLIEKFMGDKETVDPEQLQPPKPLLVFDPALLGKKLPDDQELMRQLKELKRVPKLDADIEDTDYEEIKPEE
ncbi:hypothetical protein V6R21_19975 [Limibacter armeniacum]|uniref:hypothetical protein n=1 Tax=Limibacter armeniacum TaxID=466084 RepID=UPI002FE69E81